MHIIDKQHFVLQLVLIVGIIGCGKTTKTPEIPDFLSGYSKSLKLQESDVQSYVRFSRKKGITEKDIRVYGSINRVEVDKYERVYINNDVIHVYDSTGTYVRSIGSEGRGPGEFQVINNYKVVNSLLYVFDANLSRISIFNIENFKLIKEIRVPQVSGKIGLGEFAVKEDGTLIIGLEKNEYKSENKVTERFMYYHFLDSSGAMIEPAFTTTKLTGYYTVTTEKGTSYPPIPFGRTTLFQLSKSNKMYFVWTGEIAGKILDRTGKYSSGFYSPFNNKEVKTEEDFEGLYHVLGIIDVTKNVLGDLLPNTFPAVKGFIVDDKELIWLATILPEENLVEWIILNTNGHIITRFKWPENREIKAIKNSFIYTTEFNKQKEIYTVYRYKYSIENMAGSVSN